MLSRCSHCDRPFVSAEPVEQARCPHCGQRADDEAGAGSSDAAPRPSAVPEPSSAVVAEGSQPSPAAAGAPLRQHGARPPPPGFRDGHPAWEQRERSLPGRFFSTFADVCFRPVAFFTHLSHEGVRGITWFAYTCLLLGTAGQALWRIAVLPSVQALMTQLQGGLSEDEVAAARAEQNPLVNALLDGLQSSDGFVTQLAEQLPQLEAQLWATVLLAPLTAFFTIHLLAGLVHFSVQSFRPPDQEPVAYEVTYRFLLYAFAPMVLGIVPTLGSLAGFLSFLLMLVAVSRLHRVRVLGLVAGVLFPILLLSWLWDQEALPRLAPPLTRAIGVVSPEHATADMELSDDGADGSEYPPMPPADRDHSVEVLEQGGALYSERTWDSSLGRLHIKQLVDQEPSADGSLRLSVEVTNRGEQDIERLFVEHALPAAASLSQRDDGTRARVHVGGEALADLVSETVVAEREATLYLARLPKGATAVLTLKVVGVPASALFDTAPSVGRTLQAPAAKDAAAAETSP